MVNLTSWLDDDFEFDVCCDVYADLQCEWLDMYLKMCKIMQQDLELYDVAHFFNDKIVIELDKNQYCAQALSPEAPLYLHYSHKITVMPNQCTMNEFMEEVQRMLDSFTAAGVPAQATNHTESLRNGGKA